MDKEKIEVEKIKIEMLEKEANLIFKQIVVYLTIMGSIITFLIKNITIQIDVKFLMNLLLIFAGFIGIILGNFIYWIWDSIKRLKNIKNETKYINERIKEWNI